VLGQDIEGVRGNAGLLHRALLHGPGDGRAGEEVTPILREDDPAGDRVHLVRGPPDALDAARHGDGGLDLDHQVHRPHVDPQLEGGGGHEGGEAAPLEGVLDLEALLPGHRAVVGAGHGLLRELVQGRGQALGQAPGVDEHDRGPVRPHELQEPRLDGGPDRAPLEDAGRALDHLSRRRLHGLAKAGHVLDRDLDPEVEGLLHPRVHDRHRAGRPRPAAGAATEVASHLVEGTLGGGEAEALEGASRDLLEALEGQREVGAALGPDQRVDLVHDHRLDRGEGLAGSGGENEVEGLRRGDQDVGGLPRHAGPLVGGRVPGADRHLGDVGRLLALARDPGDALDRRAQVALHVHGQGLEGGDVDDPTPFGPGRHRLEHEAVDGGQEGGEGLARPGGGEDEGALAPGDRRPAETLRLRGGGEGLGEPLPHRGTERQGCGAGAHPAIIEEPPVGSGLQEPGSTNRALLMWSSLGKSPRK
jgi:hypothetical protein